MVSAMCTSPSGTTQVTGKGRFPRLDATKDYSTPLQVETSVEYDLPPHIYPPKNADPILMIHPSYMEAVKQKKLSLSSPTLSIPITPSSSPKHKHRYMQSGDSQIQECKCRSVRGCNFPYQISVDCPLHGPRQQLSTYSNQRLYECLPHKPNVVHASALVPPVTAELRRAIQEQTKQYKLVERIAQTQKEQMHNSYKSATEQLFPWVNKHRGPGPNFVNNNPSEFGIVQSVPNSYLARATSRAIGGGSPKLRARTRRGMPANNTIPDYFGLARPSRSAGTSVLQTIQQRSRSSAPSSCNINGLPNSQNPELELLKPSNNALVSSSSFKQPKNSMLSTVGQSVDSGCSLGGDVGSTNVGGIPVYFNAKPSQMIKPTDSGFSTPVDPNDDIVMECVDYSTSSATSSNTSTQTKNAAQNPPRDLWSKETIFPGTGSHNAFLSQPNLYSTYYQAPAPLFNLVY